MIVGQQQQLQTAMSQKVTKQKKTDDKDDQENCCAGKDQTK